MKREYTKDGTTVFREETNAKDKFRTAGTLSNAALNSRSTSVDNDCFQSHCSSSSLREPDRQNWRGPLEP